MRCPVQLHGRIGSWNCYFLSTVLLCHFVVRSTNHVCCGADKVSRHYVKDFGRGQTLQAPLRYCHRNNCRHLTLLLSWVRCADLRPSAAAAGHAYPAEHADSTGHPYPHDDDREPYSHRHAWSVAYSRPADGHAAADADSIRAAYSHTDGDAFENSHGHTYYSQRDLGVHAHRDAGCGVHRGCGHTNGERPTDRYSGSRPDRDWGHAGGSNRKRHSDRNANRDGHGDAERNSDGHGE